ncbi:MAG: hypothetical protein WA139_00910 [Candidatus Aenigmatarchaeota archaeon]
MADNYIHSSELLGSMRLYGSEVLFSVDETDGGTRKEINVLGFKQYDNGVIVGVNRIKNKKTQREIVEKISVEKIRKGIPLPEMVKYGEKYKSFVVRFDEADTNNYALIKHRDFRQWDKK